MVASDTQIPTENCPFKNPTRCDETHGQNNYKAALQARFRSYVGGETLVRAINMIATAKTNGLDPLAYLPDKLSRIHNHKINRLDELPPWNWAPAQDENCKAT